MIFTIKYPWLAIVCVMLITENSLAQLDTGDYQYALSYTDFMQTVSHSNLEYTAERFNLNLAEAAIELAAVFPDPQLQVSATDNGQRRMKMGYGFSTSLEWTVELGGKRRARQELAYSHSEMTKSLLQQYYQNLRADATLAYLEGVKNKQLLQVQYDSFNNMKGIADADSVRYALGEISRVDALQSQLEARSMRNEVYQTEHEWKNSLIRLGLFMGKQLHDTLSIQTLKIPILERSFHYEGLLNEALHNRADLIAALRNKTVSEQMLKLAKANRRIDLGINLGVGSTSQVSNVVAPTPSVNAVTLGLSVPLKFSNRYKGDLKQAQWELQQTEVLYRHTELQIATEVSQVWNTYTSARKTLMQFENGILEDSGKILQGRMYSYKRGETTLLELLEAQRSYNAVQINYQEALFQYAVSLIEVERAAGIWDINF
ncbi:Cation efflux system protein CzcC [Sphingobacterium spiritivorum]|uniref:Cation efflux system protein CzcC n=1 Tax=Sphingobacterium spiritivorum TaxID=258 RepID=A0A380CZ03_SPHSI|nr:TolC family protein [Sphingobacterium spiritivorum]SUJ31008.1 Cation efflux system protein CzcC [Sphingobacterium spiritivorum]